jgi:hypothetical protein
MPSEALKARAAGRSTGPRASLRAMKQDRYSVGDSRSVRSPWVWRAFLMMTLLAVGIVIILAGNGKTGFAVAWGLIALGWFAIAMWLWRQHSRAQS